MNPLKRVEYKVTIVYLDNEKIRTSIIPVHVTSAGMALVYANKTVRNDHPNGVVVRAMVENVDLATSIRPKAVK